MRVTTVVGLGGPGLLRSQLPVLLQSHPLRKSVVHRALPDLLCEPRAVAAVAEGAAILENPSGDPRALRLDEPRLVNPVVLNTAGDGLTENLGAAVRVKITVDFWWNRLLDHLNGFLDILLIFNDRILDFDLRSAFLGDHAALPGA